MQAQYCLPVPDITENPQYSYKQSTHRLKPPKLHPPKAHSFNRNHSSAFSLVSTSAHAISFADTNSTLSASYDRSSKETYFEQCFTNLAKIGEGSFGEVFKVQSKEDDMLYAVKMSKQLFRSESYRLERLEEVRRYEQFSENSNCVRFYRAWEQEDRLFMQMELCRENLESYLERKQRIPEPKIWAILLDLLLAVKSLHDLNLIHLDIKLDNVLIGDDGSCKLADFGLVVDVDKANRIETTEGDSRYIAPEIMQGRFSKAADIFSLGVAMLELSCSIELPANGPLWQQLRSGLLPEKFIGSLSSELRNTIKIMIAPDPEKRPSADQLLSQRRFVNMLNRRRRWKPLRKIRGHIRKVRHIAWSKIRKFKDILANLISSVLVSLKLPIYKKEEHFVNNGMHTPTLCTKIISSTPTSADASRQAYSDLLYDNSFNLQRTPLITNNSARISNSTPVNSNHQHFRSRKDLYKDLTKTTLEKCEETTAASINNVSDNTNNNFLDLEDIQTDEYSSYFSRSLDLSIIPRKVLFAKIDDSD